MNFEISAEIFMRLAKIPASIPQRVLNIPSEDAESIKCVRLEYRSGNYYAIATNRKICAVYYLGTTTEADAVAHITIDPALVAQCEVEKQFGSKLQIISIPDLKMVSLKTMLGWVYPGNAGVFPPPQGRLNEWMTWVPKTEIKVSTGAMSWSMDDMVSLSAASPSGRVRFPEFIDAMHPVMLRDVKDQNWLGVFMANVVDEDTNVVRTIEPATLPEWWAK